MFGVNVGADAAEFLGFSDNVCRERAFTGGFSSEDFDYTSSGQSTDAECDVESEGASGDGIQAAAGLVAESHDGIFTEVFFHSGKNFV
jgi:hypothetical protein